MNIDENFCKSQEAIRAYIIATDNKKSNKAKVEVFSEKNVCMKEF